MADLMIKTPKMGEILVEEFMKPMGLSAYKLAQEIHVPTSRIQDIIHNRRKITVDTSLRLAKYFGVSDRYFLDIQNDIDFREMKMSLSAEIESIKPYAFYLKESTLDGYNLLRHHNAYSWRYTNRRSIQYIHL